MGAARVGIVQGEGVAGTQPRMPVAHRSDAGAHRAQVHRHVRGVGDEAAVGVEQGAGEVEPLLDVHRAGGALQRGAHGLGHAHEAAVEQLQGHGIGPVQGLDGGRGPRGGADQADQPVRVGDRRPSRGKRDLGVAADDQGRSGEGPRQPFRPDEGSLVGATARPHKPSLMLVRARVPAPPSGLGSFRLEARRLRFDRGDDPAIAGLDEAEEPPMGGFESDFDLRERSERRRQGGVGPIVAHAHPQLRRTRLDPLRPQVGPHLAGQALRRRPRGLEAIRVQRQIQPRLPQRPHLCMADPPGRQQRAVPGAQDLLGPQRLGHPAGDLTGGAAEGHQGVAARIKAALGGDAPDGLHRLFDRDRQEALGGGLGTLGFHGLGQFGEAGAGGGRVQRLVGRGTEHPGEGGRVDTAQHQIGVGHRGRAAAAVGGRARIGPGALGSGAGPEAVEAEDRAAAGRDGLDVEHRRAQLHPRDPGLLAPLQRAGKAADVGRSAAHVETEHGVPGRLGGGARDPDHPACRPREHGVPSAEGRRPDQPARRGHEEERRALQRADQAVDIGPQHRR